MMYTYAASRWQALWLLACHRPCHSCFRPCVGIAASLVGAMVAELPTGTQAGWARACSRVRTMATRWVSGRVSDLGLAGLDVQQQRGAGGAVGLAPPASAVKHGAATATHAALVGVSQLA